MIFRTKFLCLRYLEYCYAGVIIYFSETCSRFHYYCSWCIIVNEKLICSESSDSRLKNFSTDFFCLWISAQKRKVMIEFDIEDEIEEPLPFYDENYDEKHEEIELLFLNKVKT